MLTLTPGDTTRIVTGGAQCLRCENSQSGWANPGPPRKYGRACRRQCGAPWTLWWAQRGWAFFHTATLLFFHSCFPVFYSCLSTLIHHVLSQQPPAKHVSRCNSTALLAAWMFHSVPSSITGLWRGNYMTRVQPADFCSIFFPSTLWNSMRLCAGTQGF